MRFLARLVASVYSPGFYAGLPARSGTRALLYFLLLCALLTLVYAATVVPVATELQGGAAKLLSGLVDSYPDALQVRLANGRVSTNAPEPYFVANTGSDGPKNLLVIDTKTPFGVAQFNRYDTLAWLTADTLVVRDQQQAQFRTIDLSEIPDTQVDKAVIRQLGAQIAPWLSAIGPLVVLAALVGIYFAYLLRLAYLVLFALLIWLIARLCGQRWTYGVAYKAGLYAMTLPLVLGTVVGLTRGATGFNGFPFMFTLVMLAVVALNLAQAPRPEAPASPTLLTPT